MLEISIHYKTATRLPYTSPSQRKRFGPRSRFLDLQNGCVNQRGMHLILAWLIIRSGSETLLDRAWTSYNKPPSELQVQPCTARTGRYRGMQFVIQRFSRLLHLHSSISKALQGVRAATSSKNHKQASTGPAKLRLNAHSAQIRVHIGPLVTVGSTSTYIQPPPFHTKDLDHVRPAHYQYAY